MPKPMAPVTGIAPAGLGTATNLDDTQRYALEDLGVPESSPTLQFVHAPGVPLAPVIPAAAAEPRTTTPRTPRVRRGGARVPRHVVALGACAIIALAVALSVRDGVPVGPGSLGGVFGNQDTRTSAPLATKPPAPTAAPREGGKGHGSGHGGGGHGH